MRWLGSKLIQLDTVKLPAGFAKRKKEPHVKELARSIEANGVIALPVVRAKPRELVAGGDRFAALQLLGITRHEVRLVEGTDEEMEILMLEENLLRRRGDDYDAMTRRLVELTTGKIAVGASPAGSVPFAPDVELQAELATNATPRPVGRPKTAKGLAREEVAKATGRTPEAVRQAEKRARQEAQATDAPGPDAHMPPPVDTFDLELADAVVNDWFPRVRVVQEVLRDVERKLDSAQRRLSADLKNGANIQAAAYSRTYQAVHDAAFAIRQAMPESVCPWCKAQLHLTPSCSGCNETGFVSKATLEGISPELLERGAYANVPDGRGGFKSIWPTPGGKGQKVTATILSDAHADYLVDRHLARAAKEKAPRSKPRMRIEDEHGNELVPPPEPPPAEETTDDGNPF